MAYHITSSGKVDDCKAKKRACPLKSYTTKEAAQKVANFRQQIENQKPKAAIFPPSTDNLLELHKQASLYAKNDLWSNNFRQYEEEYRKGFVTAYKEGNIENTYIRKNLFNLSDSEMRIEAYKSGQARASYTLKLAQKGEPEFIQKSMSYFGQEEYPFSGKHMLDNPIKKGQKIIVPAGTHYDTTGGKSQGVTKRATTIEVEWTDGGYVDGSVNKRFVSPPKVTAAGAGGYWKTFTVTPAMLEKNNLPMRETLKTGALGLTNERSGINV